MSYLSYTKFINVKRLSVVCFLILCRLCVFGQTEAEKFKEKLLNNKVQYKELAAKELKADLVKHDFSKLFIHADNSIVYGFIGDSYQRIRVKIIKVTKDSLLVDTYHVYGKSMVKNNIDEFTGAIKISNIRRLKNMSYGVDDEYKNEGLKGEYIILADYAFSENKGQSHSGTFKGVCGSDFYLDKNSKVHYDDIDLGSSDRFVNNQFVGQWISYDDKLVKRCNWGDFRIPNSGDLDIGAGEFSPDDKYLRYGWQSVRDNDNAENAKWWK